MGRKRNQDATVAMKALTIYSLFIFSGRRYSLTELSNLLDCAKGTVTRLIHQIETPLGGHLIVVQSERSGDGNIKRGR